MLCGLLRKIPSSSVSVFLVPHYAFSRSCKIRKKNGLTLRRLAFPGVPNNVASSLRTQSPIELRIRQSKVAMLRARRLVQWARSPEQFPKAPHDSMGDRVLLHEIAVDAQGEQSHPSLEAGKLRNLSIAAAHFDGRLLTAGRGFSFWRLLGRPTQERGFLPGTEIRDGCVVPTIGGGLCMLSGALFRLAAEMNWTIHERHGHTVAPSDLTRIDATVFWPFVDLRFAPRSGSALLRIRLAGGQLRVAAYGAESERRQRMHVWRERFASVSRGFETSKIYRSREAANKHRSEFLGRDSQRILPRGLRRNCLTCEERECNARASLVETL